MQYIINKTEKEDKQISIAIMSSFTVLTFQYFVLVFFDLISTDTGQLVQLASKVIVGLLFLIALPAVLKRNKIKFIGIYFVAVFIFVLNFTLFPENWMYVKALIFPLFFTCLPSFIYAYSIKDWDILYEVMKKTSTIVFVAGTLIGLLVLTGNTSVGAYSMSLSYYMLLPAIIYLSEFFDSKSLKSTVISGISILVILSLGSRGAIMCIGVFVVFKFIKSLRKITRTRAVLYLALLLLGIIGLMFLDKILMYLYEFLLSKGIRSRSIRLFLEDGLYLSGRDRIYGDVMKAAMERPLLGLGLAGDRRILYGNNSYVHNILMELLVNFGLILGAIINAFLLYIPINLIFKKDTQKLNILIIWISIGFVHLLVSSSYLIDFKFWIYLGLFFNFFNLKKKKSKRI